MKTFGKNVKKETRRFLGKHPKAGEKLTGFERKHLKAYLKGKVLFSWGRDKTTKMPVMFEVKQEYINN